MSKRLTIALDVDGVLQNCNQYVLDIAEAMLGRELTPVSEMRSFQFDQALGISPKMWKSVDEFITNHCRPTRDMAWLPGAIAFVDRLLSRGHDVYFLTSRWKGSLYWVEDRENRLKNAFGNVDVVFAHNKARGVYDYLLDDRVENVLAAGPRGVLFDQAWNQHASANVRRVKSYDEFLQLVNT